MFKAILFDCFGVIIGQGFEYTYKLAGGDPKKDKSFINDALYKINTGQLSRQQFADLMSKRIGVSIVEWQKAVDMSEQADEQLLDYIKQLRLKYKIAVLSNASKDLLQQNFGKHKLEDYFDDLIVSAEVGLIKPDKRIFKLAADRLGVKPSECLFIDDNKINVDSAEQLGMKGLVFVSVSDLKDRLNKILN